jgi:hypothetical protein
VPLGPTNRGSISGLKESFLSHHIIPYGYLCPCLKPETDHIGMLVYMKSFSSAKKKLRNYPSFQFFPKVGKRMDMESCIPHLYHFLPRDRKT